MKSEPNKAWQRRLIVLQGLLLILLLVVGVRFYDLQVRQHEYFQQKAKRQYQQRVKLVARRGTIFDRNRHELAVSVDADSIYAIPSQFKDQSRIDQLAAVLGQSPKKLKNKLTGSRSFVWLKRKLTPKQANAVRSLNLSGIGFLKESRRYYPQKQLAANLLGFVGTDNQGLEGIELYHEDWLKGQIREVDVGTEAESRTDFNQPASTQGFDLILTLDKTIQYIAQTELAGACRKFGAQNGVVIVMDPQTGELLAVASEPSFNPNSFAEYSPDSWRNRAITDCYEPGSVLKVFTAAAALEERLFSPQDKLWCEQGKIKVAGHTIRDNASYGKLSFSRVIEVSSNVGAVKIGLALGRKRLYGYLHRFGFGAVTSIDLTGERSGILRPLSGWSKMSSGSISIGQELSVTPLQLVRAVSAIANGGLLLQPEIVKQVWNSQQQKTVKEYKKQQVKRVLSTSTCKKLTSIMVNVVEQGTGKLAGLAQYKVAGKTGSAQQIDPATGNYAEDKWVAWFLGFVPADNPRLAIVVMLAEPQRGKWASVMAAPLFGRIAQGSLEYLGVAADRLSPDKKRVKKNIGDLKIVKSGASKVKTKLIALPDLRGKSIRRVVAELAANGLQLEMQGTGRAVAQYPEPGSRLSPGSICRVSFAPEYKN